MNLEDADMTILERRASAVRAVRQIVHAIWAVARAQLPLAQAAAAEATAYLDWVDLTLRRFTEASEEQASGQSVHVVIGPERPYCGSLPAKLLAQIPPDGELGLVGTRFVEVARRDANIRKRVLFTTRGPSSPDEAAEVAQGIGLAVLSQPKPGRVELHHPTGGGSILHGAVLLHESPRRRTVVPPTFASVDEVVSAAVRQSVASRIAVGVAEAFWSEVQSRIVTADSARRACDDQLDELTVAWRTARQEQITTELLEVVAARLA